MAATDTKTEKLAKLMASATGDPVRAMALATRYSRSMAASDAAGFFELACRRLVAAGRRDVAKHCFTLARKADAQRSSIADSHALFVEFAAADVVAPMLYRDYAKRLAAEVSAAEAHEKFREVICAALDGGHVPYANLFVDLRTLAKAAGLKRAAEEDFVAGYLLRSGTLAGAPYRVWTAAEKALARVTKRDRELLDLLIASEPDPALELAEEKRRSWLAVLGNARAGEVLPAEWFLDRLGAAPIGLAYRLADQAGRALFSTSDLGDPALFCSATKESVRTAATFDESVALWVALAGTGGLSDLDESLTTMRPLVEEDEEADGDGARYLKPGLFNDFRMTDPADALVTALRTGLPAELEVPGFPEYTPHGWQNSPRIQIVQDGPRLAYRYDREHVHVFTPEGKAWHFDVGFRSGPDGMLFWHDGIDPLMSLRHPDGWRTFVYQGLASDGTLLASLDERRSIGPSAPSEADVLFPDAEQPARVDCADGRLRVHSAEGGIASSFGFGATQEPSWGEPVLPPPGWFRYQRPVDPVGSAALRRVDRATAARLIEAGLQGSDAVVRRMGDLIPEIIDERLKNGVADAAAIAAQCLQARLTISGLTGAPKPTGVPSVLVPAAGLPVTRDFGTLATWRILADLLKEAADQASKDDPYRLDVVKLPNSYRQIGFRFGALGGRALLQAWDRDDAGRQRALDELHAAVSSPLADGTGQWRMRILTSEDPWQSESEPAGQLLRTPTGAAIVLLRTSICELFMIEYSPGGRFTPVDFPGWRLHGDPVPQGWATPDRVTEFAKLLKANGPLPIRPTLAWDLAAKTGISPQDAARVCFADADVATAIDDPHRYPPEVVAAYAAAVADKWRMSNLPTGAKEYLRERLMPEDPEELWSRGPDVSGAAEWWHDCAFRGNQW
ncbi:hypothetical protein [Catenulispora subtropica]|uniref:Uncharacterized protein n=1 Tax=Catenulispora subtropica TaxID=450798 RepID=A0ABN2QXU6_9ACTN